jgi:hypothetical protein
MGEPKPTIVAWPQDTGVALAGASECATLTAAVVGDLFTSANQATLFEESAVVYQLAVVVQLPDDDGCPVA